MPNLRKVIWTNKRPAQIEDAQFFEDHLIDNDSYEQIGTNKKDIEDIKAGSLISGHDIIDASGNTLPKRKKLQFKNAEVTDAESSDTTEVDCKGEKGDAATVDVAETITLPPNTPATVENVGTSKSALLKFGIPEGADGFSPEINVKSSTENEYILEIIDSKKAVITPNLKGKDGLGTGDMLKSVYDTNDDGVVDNSSKLNGKYENQLSVANSVKVNGKTVERNVLLDEYTNTQIDSKLASVYKSKGSVETYADLPPTGSIGDVYNVIETEINYVWDGIRWDPLGLGVDLTDYYTKVQVDSKLNVKIEKLVFNFTLLSDSWAESAPFFEQRINISEMSEAYEPEVPRLITSEDQTIKAAQLKNMKVYELQTYNGYIIARCLEYKPEVNLDIKLEVFV